MTRDDNRSVAFINATSAFTTSGVGKVMGQYGFVTDYNNSRYLNLNASLTVSTANENRVNNFNVKMYVKV